MRKHHPENERTKRAYAIYLQEARQLSQASVDKALAALDRFDAANGYKSFKLFHIEQPRAFKDKLAQEINPATGKPLSKATTSAILKELREFFRWLSQEPGYRKRIRYTDAAYFNVSRRDQRIARSAPQRPSP